MVSNEVSLLSMVNRKGSGRRHSWSISGYYSGIHLEKLRKIIKNMSQNNQQTGQFSNWVLLSTNLIVPLFFFKKMNLSNIILKLWTYSEKFSGSLAPYSHQPKLNKQNLIQNLHDDTILSSLT